MKIIPEFHSSDCCEMELLNHILIIARRYNNEGEAFHYSSGDRSRFGLHYIQRFGSQPYSCKQWPESYENEGFPMNASRI